MAGRVQADRRYLTTWVTPEDADRLIAGAEASEQSVTDYLRDVLVTFLEFEASLGNERRAR